MRLKPDETLVSGLLLSYGIIFSRTPSQTSVALQKVPQDQFRLVPQQRSVERDQTVALHRITPSASIGMGPISNFRGSFRKMRSVFRKPLPINQGIRVSNNNFINDDGSQYELASVHEPDGDEVETTQIKENSGKKKVLILMSDTGGGHRASAKALEEAFDQISPGQIECHIVDIWTEHAPFPYNRFVPVYKVLAKYPFLWRGFWHYGQFPITRWFQERVTMTACYKRFKGVMDGVQPDMVVSVHPLCQDIPLRIMDLEKKKKRPPFVTVVTDLGSAHPTWFDPRVDLCFVPSDRVRAIAEKHGLREHQIRQHGLPIRAGFWKPDDRPKEEIRTELGLDTKMPTALIVGGGDGVGGVARITEAIEAEVVSGGPITDGLHGVVEHPKTQVVVVCGSNEQVRAKLAAKDWNDRVSVNVQGFVSNMEDYMAASDCIVTKAGPGTIAEAMCRGLPTMLSCFLPGQEKGNVDYVQELGFGEYSSNPKEIASTVMSWIDNPDHLSELSTLARDNGRPGATYDIAHDLLEVLGGGSTESRSPPPSMQT
mmetsp:Transcript_46306/g.63003  ORF Transcript_46306/g.63003 Transcript_46306/m.63003 type:complete len:541 (-) Transcript_46306:567-2189(-)